MAEIKIDREKCIKCGACIKDCITYSLDTDSEGFARVRDDGESLCISCQHCFSICPAGAITVNNKKPEDAFELNYSKPEDVLNLIRSRKSIRQFKDEEIPTELMQKIKEMLPYIPTGCNYNSLHFSFVESKNIMDKIRAYTVEKLLKIVSNRFTAKYAGKFIRFKEAFERGEDIIYRNAPHMVVVSASIKAPCANVDPIIALSYIELYAQSLGLGTCWCGFAQACLKIMPKFSSVLQIPDGYKPVYALLLGMPAVNYKRTTLPEEFPIAEIKDISLKEMSFIDKVKRLFLNVIR